MYIYIPPPGSAAGLGSRWAEGRASSFQRNNKYTQICKIVLLCNKCSTIVIFVYCVISLKGITKRRGEPVGGTTTT